MKINASKPQNIRENNLRLILAEIYAHKEMTVQEMSNETGISKTTINKLMTELASVGIILSSGKGDSTPSGGRKPEVYGFNKIYKYIISTEIYENSIYCCIMNLECEILYNYVDELDEVLEFKEIINRLRSRIKQALQETNLDIGQIASVVVNCSAIVDESRGVIENSTIGSWEGELPVSESLADMFDENTEIIVNNISRFSGYAELKKNPDFKDQRIATILFWDDTVGGAIIRRGRYENGENHLIGEIGHLVIKPDENVKYMNNASGQFENLTNSSAVLNYAKVNGSRHKDSVLYNSIRHKKVTLDEIFDAYVNGDEFAEEIVNRSAYYIALVIHYISLIYDPKYFIIQGFYYKAGEKLIDTLYDMVNKLLPFCKMKSFVIQYSAYAGDYKIAFNIGAGLYAVEKLIENQFHLIL